MLAECIMIYIYMYVCIKKYIILVHEVENILNGITKFYHDGDILKAYEHLET